MTTADFAANDELHLMAIAAPRIRPAPSDHDRKQTLRVVIFVGMTNTDRGTLKFVEMTIANTLCVLQARSPSV